MRSALCSALALCLLGLASGATSWERQGSADRAGPRDGLPPGKIAAPDGSVGSAGATGPQDPLAELHRYIVIQHTQGFQWVEGQSFRTQPGIRDHIKHYRALADEGRLILGGPFLDDSGGLMIVSGDLDELTVYAFEDPAVEQGVLGVKIAEWSVRRTSDDPLASGGLRPEIRCVVLHNEGNRDSTRAAPVGPVPDRAVGITEGVSMSGPFTDGSGGLIVASPGLLMGDWGNSTVGILAATPGVRHAEVREWLIVFKHEPDSR